MISPPKNLFEKAYVFSFFSKLDIHTITDIQLLHNEKVNNQTKFSFEVLPSVILFIDEITLQYHFTNPCNLVKQ